jgi:hypothetical protein
LADVKRVSIRRPCAFTAKLGIRTGGEKTGVVRAFLATQRQIIMIIGLRAKSPFTSGKINWVRFAGPTKPIQGRHTSWPPDHPVSKNYTFCAHLNYYVLRLQLKFDQILS